MANRIITDGSTDRVAHAPPVVLPESARLFGERASRFEQLATGHSMAEYLRLMARVARAQQSAFDAHPAFPLPEAALAQSRQYGMPPLSAQGHARAPIWRDDLREIVMQVGRDGGEQLRRTLAALAALDDDAAFVPFVGAALQVYFTRQAAQLAVADVSSCDVATVCPVCATRPIGSVLRIGGAQANLRYLVCALCQTEWNMVRVKCSSCEGDKGVHYLSLSQAPEQAEAAQAAVRAEACDECRSYLKLFAQDKDPQVDPYADDLATLALDVLVDEQGFARTGPNLLFHPGSA